jgi:hypothetical protein
MANATTHWRFIFWLVFSKNGHIRQTIREPDVSRDERKMQMQVDLPKSLWSSPALKASVLVTEDNNEPSFTFDLQAAGDALRSALGVDVDIQIVPPALTAPDNEESND